MQLFMRNVAFAASELDVQLAISAKLHGPPFPTNPRTNFDVELFKQKSKKFGMLTLPSADLCQTFLALYGASGIDVKGRRIYFSPNTRLPNQAAIERVTSSEWEDPEILRQKQAEMATASSPIKLHKYLFGRFCRDGAFSAEMEGSGFVACDPELRQLQIKSIGQDQQASTASEQLMTTLAQILSSYTLGDTEIEDYVRYSSSHISAMAVPDATTNGPFHVFIESNLLPVFERKTTDTHPITNDQETSSIRLECLPTHHLMPVAYYGICLAFVNRHDLETFLERVKLLHLRTPHRRTISIVYRELYSETKLTQLDRLITSLDFALAFEVEKAVYSGLLDPAEILESMSNKLPELQIMHQSSAADMFRRFANSLEVPSLLGYIPHHRPNPRRRRRRRGHHRYQDLEPEAQSLVSQLDEAISAYIAEQYRPKSRFAPSPAIYQSYHVVLTPCTRFLEGPLPDQSNSVLRQWGNYESFLRISFQDENRGLLRREPGLSLDELLISRFRKVLIHGLRVAGRDFRFLSYSMSGLREYSFWFMTPFEFEGTLIDAEGIRARMGDFSLLTHRPALLGARWSQAFSASDPSISLAANEIRRIPDRVSTTGSVFTDGCGTISLELSKTVWTAVQKARRSTSRSKEIPSGVQIRISGAKGMLVMDPTLEGNVICLRPSQMKFDAPNLRTLDIAVTTQKPSPMFLNRPLILLLEHHGVPNLNIIALQDMAVREIQSILDSFSQASKLFSQHGLGASFRLPSLYKNILTQLKLDVWTETRNTGLDHDLLKTCLVYATTYILREIKHRARIPVPGSFTLIGVSDEWGCLREGQIYATVHDERTGLHEPITGRVLITRSPQIHPGDVQFVEAVRRPELEHLTNVVVFSCEGSRSLPSCLGGGDLDGDPYNLIIDHNLFPPKGYTSTPGSYIGLPYKETAHQCTVEDVADFVIDYIKSDLVGYISTLHLRIADLDENGPACSACLQLAEKASHAVDFPKRGTPVNFRDLPRPPNQSRPDFLSEEGVNPTANSGFYPSKRVLGILYRNVPIEEYLPVPKGEEFLPSDGLKIETAIQCLRLEALGLPLLDRDIDDNLREEMDHMLDAYTDQLFTIAKTHTISKRPNDYLSEAELISGTIQAHWVNHRKRREAIHAMNLQTHELTKTIRKELRTTNFDPLAELEDLDEDEDYYSGEEDDEYGVATQNEVKKFERAWAAWVVSEDFLRDNPRAFGPQSFGLIALGILLEIVRELRENVV